MKIYCGGRGSGKTIKAIQLSVEKQMPIVCFGYNHIEYIKHIAKDMNLKIPEPVMFDDVRRRVIGRRGLIVDDLDLILSRIFDDEVHYVTMEVCGIEKLERSDT
jgi:hypothetical protein